MRIPNAGPARPASRASAAKANLRYRAGSRPGPAGARGRPRCGRTGREGTAERERARGQGSPFAGPFPERHCLPLGDTRSPCWPRRVPLGSLAGSGREVCPPGPSSGGTQWWLHKVPTPIWTCGADARMCHCVGLASCPEDLPEAHRARCFFSSGRLTQRNRQVLEVRVSGTPRGVLWGGIVQIL